MPVSSNYLIHVGRRWSSGLRSRTSYYPDGQLFFPGTSTSSTNKTWSPWHISEVLKVVFNKNHSINACLGWEQSNNKNNRNILWKASTRRNYREFELVLEIRSLLDKALLKARYGPINLLLQELSHGISDLAFPFWLDMATYLYFSPIFTTGCRKTK